MQIDAASLSKTVDSLNDVIFFERNIPAEQRVEAARWIAARSGLPGAYAGTFALLDRERKNGIQLFTGERLTNASARHVIGEECCRVLRLLKVKNRMVTEALDRATSSLLGCLQRSEAQCDHRMGGNPGLFCCGNCTVGLWRHLTAGGLDRREERLESGARKLRTSRDGLGRWRGFPFWYSVSALVEMGLKSAISELRYARPLLERAAKNQSNGSPYVARRSELARRALSML